MIESELEENPPTDPEQLARRVMVWSARFAGRSLEQFLKKYPQHAELFAHASAGFAVTVTGILSDHPKVALINIIDGREIEVAHVDLRATGSQSRTLN